MDLKQMSEEYQEYPCILPLYLLCVPSTRMATSVTSLGGHLSTHISIISLFLCLYPHPVSLALFPLLHLSMQSLCTVFPLKQDVSTSWYHVCPVFLLSDLRGSFSLGQFFYSLVLFLTHINNIFDVGKEEEGSDSSPCCIWGKPCLRGLMRTR